MFKVENSKENREKFTLPSWIAAIAKHSQCCLNLCLSQISGANFNTTDSFSKLVSLILIHDVIMTKERLIRQSARLHAHFCHAIWAIF